MNQNQKYDEWLSIFKPQKYSFFLTLNFETLSFYRYRRKFCVFWGRDVLTDSIGVQIE